MQTRHGVVKCPKKYVPSPPRGAPRDGISAITRVCDALCVAGTPLRGPRAAVRGRWTPACAGVSGRNASLLRQLRYQLMEFGLRPNAEGAGAHASMRGEREREFGGVIAVRSIQDDQEIAVTRCQIDFLDLHPDLLGQLLGGFATLGRLLDGTDSLLGPAERTHEHRHAVLHTRMIASRCGSGRQPWMSVQ